MGLVRFYQKFLSPLTMGACRYYPSCSMYALWLLQFENPLLAVFKIMYRILRCNQLFAGGIAYPLVRLKLKNIVFEPKSVKYWLVPSTNVNFLDIISPFDKTYTMRVYIIKSLF
ncbi:membrane protein insertion efficiency factor YidD [Helicobacter jaachi]|uniref:Membrane protein insertion efficiency factor YidD n=1 Tax=Helicobacter jaachi TaxID=1677920 RepID=A0A4U8TAD2_9HELI|nr:membrane protein insertion efficiency factor YidD [Helicobacter jaachi]